MRQTQPLNPPLLQADSLEEAIQIVNANEHGNGTALFTRSGAAARKFQHDIDVGMVRRCRQAGSCALLLPASKAASAPARYPVLPAHNSRAPLPPRLKPPPVHHHP